MGDESERNSGSQFWTPLRRKDLPPEAVKQTQSMLERIPDLPVSVQRVIQMASDPDCDSKEITEVVSSDPVLVSHILMMVNSSYYGISRKIDNLRLAIVLLGFNEVRNVAVRCGYSQVMSQAGGMSGDTKSLWEHSYLVSLCAESLIREDNPQRKGITLTLGMLHDIGKFALYAIGIIMRQKGIRPRQTGEVSRGMCLLEKEERLFGINHAVIGGMLAERWNLSERIRTAIECHHLPSFFGVSEIPSAHIEDVSTVCIADIMVNLAANPSLPVKTPHPYFYEVLGLDPSSGQTIPPEVIEKIERARDFIRQFK